MNCNLAWCGSVGWSHLRVDSEHCCWDAAIHPTKLLTSL